MSFPGIPLAPLHADRLAHIAEPVRTTPATLLARKRGDHMAVRKSLIAASLVFITSLAAPSKASADWLFTPFIGWNWGGAANFVDLDDFDDEFEQRVNFGASFGWM